MSVTPGNEYEHDTTGDSGEISRRALVRRVAVGTAGGGLALAGGLGLTAAQTPEASPSPSPGASPAASPVMLGAAGELVVYSGRNEELIGPAIELCQEQTGVQAEVRYGQTAELAVTLLEEGENSPASLYIAQDAGALGQLAAEGRLAQLPEEILNRVDERFRSPEGVWVGISGRARVLVYNTDMLSEDDLPASVLDLTNEEWAGRVGWAPENGSFQAFVTALRQVEGEDGARAWLEGMLANDPVEFESNGAIVTAVANGEIPVGLVNHYYKYELQAELGEELPVENYFFPNGDIGSLVNVAGVGIVEGSPNQEQALAIIDCFLRAEAQQYFAEATFEYPLIADVEPAAELRPLDEIDSPNIDLSDLADLQGTLELLTEVGVL
ncbi:MAG: iron ABC transporter substrate-binding protein [Chloroflexota bacterium]|nr:iron ABC transporter substrate-binding protein [Chloroflexota bacterium]